VPLSLFRLVKAKHAAGAFDGEGARRFGGRWNERGTAVVYLGGTLSLAALETFVHLSVADARLAFVAIEVVVPDGIRIAHFLPGDLPDDWRAEPPPTETKALGSGWARAAGTLLLRVPSVIVPREWNYLLNPAHPDFSRLRIRPPEPFGFDERMWK
jgi:RES domain-containing protein